ncbi:hypothetical protein Tco_0388276, partial [Tanacetum coccineum]
MFKDSNFDDLDDLVDEGMAFVQEKDAENQLVEKTGLRGNNAAGNNQSKIPPQTRTNHRPRCFEGYYINPKAVYE